MHDIILKIAKSNMSDKAKLQAITAIAELQSTRKKLYKARTQGAAQKRRADALFADLVAEYNDNK